MLDIELCVYNHDKKYSSIKSAEIPTFTICPQYEAGYKKDILESQYNLTPRDMRLFNYPSNIANSRDFFLDLTYNVSELIQSFAIHVSEVGPDLIADGTFQVQNNQVLAPDQSTTYELEDWFKTISWISFGRCYSLEIIPEFKKRIVS